MAKSCVHKAVEPQAGSSCSQHDEPYTGTHFYPNPFNLRAGYHIDIKGDWVPNDKSEGGSSSSSLVIPDAGEQVAKNDLQSQETPDANLDTIAENTQDKEPGNPEFVDEEKESYLLDKRRPVKWSG